MMTMNGKPRFSAEDVLAALTKAVEAEGADYTYEHPLIEVADEYDGAPTWVKSDECLYAVPSDGAPSCIVGHAIFTLDPEVFQELARVEDQRGAEVAEDLSDRGYLPPDFWDPRGMAVAAAAQRCQDSGDSWGTALSAAEAAYAHSQEG